MAACTQITNRLQAYVDGELRSSERVVLEQHVEECRDCRSQLRQVQRGSALLFEVLSEVRLDRDLVQYTMDHLPELEHPAVDVAGVNFRAKHPTLMRERFVRLLPIALAVLLVFLAAVLNNNWPAPMMALDTVGIVSYSQGDAFRIEEGSTDRDDAVLRTFASPGDRFETGDNSSLMLKLLGPTEVRVAGGTRILIHDDRKLSVEKGRVFLDVAGNKRLFRILTPTGDITVFGTSFDVRVDAQRTTVVVMEGEVQLLSVADESVFSIVRAGQTASVSPEQTSIRPGPADVAVLTEWARHITADEEAEAIFASRISPLQVVSEVSGRSGFYVNTLGKPLEAIIIEWEPTSPFSAYTSYEMFVYNDRNEPLFRSRLDGSLFSDPHVTSYEIENTGNRREKLKHIFVKFVPEEGGASREVAITKLVARIGA